MRRVEIEKRQEIINGQLQPVKFWITTWRPSVAGIRSELIDQVMSLDGETAAELAKQLTDLLAKDSTN